jgi:WD40 repeat protein
MARAAFLGVCWFFLALLSPAAPIPATKVDRHGDPLPPGAVARLGTIRLRGSSACFTPDSKQIATLSDRAVCLWNVKTGALDRRIGVKESFHIMAFSPDGKRFATATNGGIDVAVYDIAAAKPIFTFQTRSGEGRSYMVPRTHSLTFSADGKKLFSVDDSFGHVWDLTTGKSLSRIRFAADLDSKCNTVVFSRDGHFLVTASQSRPRFHIWDVATGKRLHELTGRRRGLRCAAFSPDGTTLATGGERAIRLWSTKTGDLLHLLDKPVGDAVSVDFSPDGKRLCAAYNLLHFSAGLQKILLWDLTRREIKLTLDAPDVRRAFFSPNGKVLAWESDGGAVTLLDAATGKELHSFEAHTGPVSAVAYSPDGKLIATASQDNDVRLWDARTSKPLLRLRGHTDHVNALAFSRDGTLLASGSRDQTVAIWEVSTGKRKWSLEGHDNEVRSVAFAPDGRTVAGGGYNYAAVGWDVGTGEQRWSLKESESVTTALAFSPDGKLLASGGDKSVRIWDVNASKRIKEISTGNNHSVTSVAISPDGKTLATGCDLKLFIHDLKSGNRLATLPGHSNERGSLAFSRDGKLLASASDGWWDTAGKNLHLWDTKTWKEAPRLAIPKRLAIRAVAFSPDGGFLATGSNNTDVLIWKLVK